MSYVPSALDDLDGVVEDAFSAFGLDSSYTISMARHAASIQSKRTVWSTRLELRAAAKVAARMCTSSPAAYCVNPSPCGTGQCPFAVGDLADIQVGESEGLLDRPAPSDFPTFNVDIMIRPLLALRKERARAA